jgi:diguanylate cyclase (GGDEF)-like protein
METMETMGTMGTMGTIGESGKISIIGHLLSLPKKTTRNAPACCHEGAVKAMRLSEEAGYERGLAYAHLSLGECALYTERDGVGNIPAGSAMSHYAEANRIFGKIGDIEGCMLAELGMAVYHAEHGRLGEAESASARVLSLAAASADSTVSAASADSTVSAASAASAVSAVSAASAASASLRICALIDAYTVYGVIRTAQARYDEAEQHLKKALGYCIGDLAAKAAAVLNRLGRIEGFRGKKDAAAKLFTQSSEIAARDMEYRTAASSSRQLARIFYERDQFGEYERYFEQASGFIYNAVKNEAENVLQCMQSYYNNENVRLASELEFVAKTVSELANHDTLTGIPNRRLLLELAPKAFANALRTNSKAAFLFMDLDSFKPINDKYGHQAGDAVLKEFVTRVLGQIRSSDIFARIGGDEFIIIMTDLKVVSHTGILAQKIIRETAKPFVIRGTENFVGVSIGISIFPDDSRDTDVLIVMADEAMYKVKYNSKNNYAYYKDLL